MNGPDIRSHNNRNDGLLEWYRVAAPRCVEGAAVFRLKNEPVNHVQVRADSCDKL